MNEIRGRRNVATRHKIIQYKCSTLLVLKSNKISKNKETVLKFLL